MMPPLFSVAVIPEGPADGLLDPGDVLLEVDGRSCLSFLQLESALDDHTGKDIEVKIQRGGEDIIMAIPVQDLHSLIPSEYLAVSQSIAHPVSYQVAKKYHLPLKGVFVAYGGYMYRTCNLPAFCIITRIGADETTTLDEYQKALEGKEDNLLRAD